MAINVSEINAALEQIEINKGISRDRVIDALKESMAKAYRKSLGGDDALVEVNFDLDSGVIEMYQVKNVVEEVQDDLLEISVEDAEEEDKSKKYKVGDQFKIYANLDELRKAIVLTVKNLMKQKFAEAEKEVLHEQFKDKINTLITGRVEQYDDRGASINIGRTSVYLPRKEMIKDERFAIGDNIKLFVSSVAATGNKGAQIVVSRSNEGFLKALMTEEIHDIYDGTIIIKSVAREAGERSKVSVYSNDVNVDPAGACIGPNASRIQKVVSQLGNGSSKEKIDIIAYKDNTGLYIMEALKPARVVGIKVDEENKSALVVVKDDSLSLAIGRKGVNARLAVALTGYKIDIKIESDALAEGIEYQTFDELNSLEMEAKAKKIAEAQREALVYQQTTETALPGLPEGYVAPQARNYEEETNDFDATLEEVAEEEVAVAPKAEEAAPVVEEAPAKEEAPVVEEEVKPVEEAPTTSVKTTTTLEDLEKSLAEEGNKQQKRNSGNRRKKKTEEEKEETSVARTDGPRMSIYTEEELKELEEEENEEIDSEEDDIDYDEYDQYYDED